MKKFKWLVLVLLLAACSSEDPEPVCDNAKAIKVLEANIKAYSQYGTSRDELVKMRAELDSLKATCN